MRFQTLRNPAVRTRARRLDPALILLTGVDASFDFNFNDDLHSASLCAAAPHCATLSERSIPDLFHSRVGNFLTSSVIIVSPVSGNSQRAHTQRQVSPHTIRSYRDTFRLLLQFAAKRLHKLPSALALSELDPGLIGAFLDQSEK